MTMKKFDLAKSMALKINGKMKSAGAPDRFAQGAAHALDKRERLLRDAAAGLVPFACKLPADLVRELNERGSAHEGGVNAVVAELLAKGLGDAPRAQA